MLLVSGERVRVEGVGKPSQCSAYQGFTDAIAQMIDRAVKEVCCSVSKRVRPEGRRSENTWCERL
jgi:hypothetical protein